MDQSAWRRRPRRGRTSYRSSCRWTADPEGPCIREGHRARRRRRGGHHMELKSATTVTKSPEEVFEFWSAFDRFPSFMAHVDAVQMTGPRTSHWRVSAPFDREVEWDAETT